MKNIINFIIKHHAFFIFLFLQIIAFNLIIQNNIYHKNKIINSANSITGKIYEIESNITAYFDLRETNKRLAKENAELHTLSPAAFISHYVYDYQIINDTVYNQKFKFTSAEVINKSTNNRNNYLTLNKGRKHGVEPMMGVISTEGIVGIVNEVSDNFSTVLTVLHSQSHISALLKKQKYKGDLYWPGTDYKYAKLKDIEQHVMIKAGDTVITSGFSAIFPKGILVGTVKEFELNEGKTFYDISVELSTNFKTISHVYVINNMLKNEQLELENKMEDNEL